MMQQLHCCRRQNWWAKRQRLRRHWHPQSLHSQLQARVGPLKGQCQRQRLDQC